MKKWIGPLFSVFLIVVTLAIHGDFQNPKESMDKEESRIIHAQYREQASKKGGKDSHFITLLKELKETVDGWLKSLNEKIEREDVTRFKVRFLEILRSILEWVKEKIDSYLESSEQDTPLKKEGAFREVRLKGSPFSERG